MKTVQSIADLKDHALRTGASVELGGSRFNTERARVNPQPLPSPAPVSGSHTGPNPEAMQQVVLAMAQQLTQAQQLQQTGQTGLAQQLATAITDALAKAQAPQVHVDAPHMPAFPELPRAPRKWVFSITRDDQGLLSAITATAA